MKNILVTGGAGFIGSHLCERLLARGHYVECWDNLFTSTMENINHLLVVPNFKFCKHDVRFSGILSRDFDEIYNLACPAAPGHYQYKPIYTFETCMKGTLNCLKIAESCGAKMVQASTSEVYGDPTVHPQVESYWGNVNPIGPRACYDESKRVAETICMDYHRQFGVDVKIARIFNTYGPRMHPYDGRVVSNFIRQTVTGEPITIYGTGSQTRSFCFRDDLIEGLLALMDVEDFTGPVNLGNPEEFTILELADTIVRIVGCRTKIQWKPAPVDDPVRRKPDITLARQKLNWQPEWNLTTGLIRTINWFRDIDLSKYTPPTPNY
jgi:UDP-glucuronate decarboxylase